MAKPTETEELEQLNIKLKPGDQIAVPRRAMVDEIVGVIGPKSTLILWDLLINLRREDDLDSQLLRRMKEEYLAGDENTCAGLIIGVLQKWESPDNQPQMGKFLAGMREHAVFGFSESIAEKLKGRNEPAREKILDAVKTLRSLFANTLVKANFKDVQIN